MHEFTPLLAASIFNLFALTVSFFCLNPLENFNLSTYLNCIFNFDSKPFIFDWFRCNQLSIDVDQSMICLIHEKIILILNIDIFHIFTCRIDQHVYLDLFPFIHPDQW